MVKTVSLHINTHTHICHSWRHNSDTQTAVRSMTHHRVGSHRHSGAVGQVVEDVGRFGQQVAAERPHVTFVLCSMSLCDLYVVFNVTL